MTNPLTQYTRQEKLFIRLPSNNQYNVNKLIPNMVDGEVGIRAMTASDEIVAKTPDALMNGNSIVTMIESCVPSLTNARELILPDAEALLLGIKVASYGDTVEIMATCPTCNHENAFDANLRSMLDNMKILDSEYKIPLNDSKLIIFLKPYTLDNQITNSIKTFKENKMMNEMLDNEDDLTLKNEMMISSIQEIADMSFELVAHCVDKIVTLDGDTIALTDEQLIEGIKDLSVSDAKMVINKVNEINNIGVVKSVEAVCEECKHTWLTEMSLNPSDFFEVSSYI